MAAYLFVQITILDGDRWPAYRAAVGPCVERFGGRYIVRNATVELLEGSYDGRRVVAFEFPSMEAIRAFWNSAEYAQIKRLREGAAELDAWALPGL